MGRIDVRAVQADWLNLILLTKGEIMTPEQEKAINELRDAGYAVVVYSPQELQGVSRDRLEKRLIADGADHIEDLKEIENN